jgi:Fe-Mn family superoxide dismutase
MTPDGGGRPDGGLAEAITEHFGSFERFHGQMSAATTLVQGSGWGCCATSRRRSG